MGIPMGSSNVRCRHDHPLAADELETAVPPVVHPDAVMADGHSGVRGADRHLPVCDCGHATVYIFPVLGKRQ